MFFFPSVSSYYPKLLLQRYIWFIIVLINIWIFRLENTLIFMTIMDLYVWFSKSACNKPFRTQNGHGCSGCTYCKQSNNISILSQMEKGNTVGKFAPPPLVYRRLGGSFFFKRVEYHFWETPKTPKSYGMGFIDGLPSKGVYREKEKRCFYGHFPYLP